MVKKRTCTAHCSKQLGPAWFHMHAVQRSNTPKGIPTKSACGTVRNVAGAPPHDCVGEGRGSGAPLLGPNATCLLFYTKAIGLHMTYAILPHW
eukprot:5572821-Ditylum_brightwellii.AAC.1